MSAVAVENLLALLYTNTGVRKRFLSDPHTVLADFDVNDTERAHLLNMDWAGLVLAGNGFGYKRWKATQWRHAAAYIFTSFDDLFGEDDVLALGTLLVERISANRFKQRRLRLTHNGIVSETLDVMPENQINHEHVLLERQELSAVAEVWLKLTGVNLHHHHLIRAYLFRATPDSVGKGEILHPRPGACNTYVPLSSRCDDGSPAGHITALMNDGQAIIREPLVPGRAITFPADVAQRIDVGEANSDLKCPIDFLCFKTLSAAV